MPTESTASPEPIADWRQVPPREREAHFNPRAAVPEAQVLLEARAKRSAAVRARIAGAYDLRYGPGRKQTFDLHRPAHVDGPAPALVFIHGGFWRALDKSDHSYVAPPFLEAGIAVVNFNYDLCPAVSLTALVEQVLAGIAHVAREADALGLDARRLALMGHSAGAHCLAMALAEDWGGRGPPAPAIRAGVCISGVYDPEIALHTSINSEIGLTLDEAAANNALARPPRPGPELLVTAGGDEPPGWIGQSVAFHVLAREAGIASRFEIVPGANHFTILDTAVEPGHMHNRLIMDVLARTLA